MNKVSNWDKFKLLLWKNWLLQWNNKWQLVVEILLPVVFAMLLVFVRRLVVPQPMPEIRYPPVKISDIKIFKHFLDLSSRGHTLLKILLPKASKAVGLDHPIKLPEFKLVYSPNTSPDFNDIIKSASDSLQLKEPQGVLNADELTYALTRGNYLAGVEIDENAEYPRQFSFALRFPSELRTSPMVIPLTWSTAKLFVSFGLSGPRNVNDTDGGVPPGYLREGFLPIQHAISTAYIKKAGGIETLPEVEMQRFPYPDYTYDPLLNGLASMMSLIIMLSFTYPCTYITKYVTAEKEKQLKEIMKIMGLENWLHWAAWFIKSFIMLGISSILIVIFMKVHWAHDVSVLTNSDFTALVFFLLIYVTASICFCFMLATFFSRANTAAAVTGLLWFIAYLPFSFTMNSYDQMTLAEKLILSLLSNTAMGFGFKVILGWEGKGEGLQWNNIFSPVSVDDSLTLGDIILMMLLSSAIYLLICLYLEQIFPGDIGVPRKWYFPFTSEFWWGNRADATDPDNQPVDNKHSHNSGAFEPEPTGKRAGVHVKNLKKKFGGKYAVKDLSMKMYENDITVLLGHNGAGKTTTISMLTGIFPPTAGTAIINGSDIRSNMDGARLSMGICPQHNVLFDSLTVANHLEFYSRLKGLKGGAVQREVKKYLKIIHLEDKANVASSKLSGGMKRKLSICCALCGDTKVVLCDEPSSGMDPAARRQLWDLLQSEKVGRTVLLTTHFMDEADVLGDRIAIMCEGELKCMGTSFFLKKKYGSGYRLICVKLKDCVTEEVTAMLNKFIPGIRPVSDVGAELCYALPDSYTPIFEKMFRALEDNSDQLKLNGYGISITSLEEVFMKVGADNCGNTGGDTNSLTALNGAGGARRLDEDLESVHSDRPFSEKPNLLEGSKLCRNQWHAMLLKKYLYTLRNKLLLFVQNFMPTFFVIVTILIARSRGTFQPLPRMTVSLAQYPRTVSALERDISLNDLDADAQEVRIADQYKALVKSYGSGHELVSTGKKTFSEYIIDLGKTMQVFVNNHYMTSATVSKGKITAWLNNQPLHTAPLTVNMVHNAMARALVHPDAEITVTNAPLPYTAETKIAELNIGNSLGTQLALNLCFCMCFVSGFYILFLIKERESRAKLLQFVSGVNVWTFWLTQLIWDMITYAITAVVVILVIACFQEEGFSQISELSRYLFVFIIFGLSAIPLTYLLSFLFTEPATGFARVSTLYIFSGMALFMAIFVMSFEFFDTKETADKLQIIVRAFPHFSLANSMNKLNMNTATRKACSNPILAALPDKLRCKMVPKCCNTIPFFDWAEPGILPEVVYLLTTAVIFFMLLILNEYGAFTGMIYWINSLIRKPLKPSASTDPENEDVTAEKERISNMSKDEIDSQNLVLDRVSKRYKNFLAVNEISLCVKSNECFGLLGVNGAGKTSTFKMLTGDERISSGAAYVKGLSLKQDMIEINKEIGYCPQFDALFDDLTGREIVKIICLLRGLPRREIFKFSEELCRSFGFAKHIDKIVKAYSGGNKRKLSVALAVIGSPSIIYLDEPTTSMDPAARRHLWNIVCRIRDSGKSIVLTSHSMEECEALCTRLAIMVNGVFKCIGSTQHLKNKFSKGLILKIKLKRRDEPRTSMTDQSKTDNLSSDENERAINDQLAENDAQNIKRFIQEKFPDSVLKEEYLCIFTFYIPLTRIRWSKIFGLMESNRTRLNIEDYSISQTTLEEIFLEFAKLQKSTTHN